MPLNFFKSFAENTDVIGGGLLRCKASNYFRKYISYAVVEKKLR